MKKQNEGRRNRQIRLYAAGMAALVLLVAAALFLPRMVFRIQDACQCRGYQLSVRKEQDITLLSTSYEPSLYQRLLHYAEDIQTGREIYVTSRELEPNQELSDFLDSSIGLKQDAVAVLADMDIVPYSMIYDSRVSTWTQHVIYNDSYAGGVNFILWAVELQTKDGSRFRLLLDAETGSVYGVSAKWQEKNEKKQEKGNTSLTALFDVTSEEAWFMLAYLYGAFAADSLEWYDIGNYEIKGTEEGYSVETVLESGESVAVWESGENGEEIYRAVFPYGNYGLEFRVGMTGEGRILAGFPQIYEQIPGFADFETE